MRKNDGNERHLLISMMMSPSAFFTKYLKRNAFEKSFKEHIAAEMNIKSEEGDASAVFPVNAQRKRRKSSVRRRRASFVLEQAPPDQHRVEGTTVEEKKQIYLRSSFAYAKWEA